MTPLQFYDDRTIVAQEAAKLQRIVEEKSRRGLSPVGKQEQMRAMLAERLLEQANLPWMN